MADRFVWTHSFPGIELYMLALTLLDSRVTRKITASQYLSAYFREIPDGEKHGLWNRIIRNQGPWFAARSPWNQGPWFAAVAVESRKLHPKFCFIIIL